MPVRTPGRAGRLAGLAMKALVIGREGCPHPLAWRLAQSPAVTALYTAPRQLRQQPAGRQPWI